MCGIAGILSSRLVSAETIGRMTAALAHRGPDDEGLWIDAEAGIGLGHRRLGVVDLSPAGHEPMLSSSGRYVATFNGEIYNYLSLRTRLENEGGAPGGGWRGHSDIEVLLQAIDQWGLERSLREAVGMFAFALWDRRQRSLRLVRDRFGEKPLYYGWVGPDFLFASELKAFRCHPDFQAEVDPGALRLYAERTYIPAPFSIYRRIFKVPPGCILNVSREAAAQSSNEPVSESAGRAISLERYWSYKCAVVDGLADPIRDEADAVAELGSALTRAVAEQSVADVPVGMFLSGGIDSSTVAALYQRIASRPVSTFSIGFEDPAYDEAPFARQVAERLGTVHHEQIVTEQDALDTIPLLPTIYTEPFADSSQIPTYLVSRAARSKVTVALTGDGADELLGGYYRHSHAPALWRKIDRMPRAIRAFATPLSHVPASIWSGLDGLFSARAGFNVGARVKKGLRLAATARDLDDVYASLLDEWHFEKPAVLGFRKAAAHWDLAVPGAPDETRLMYCDAVSYLPDDILCKVDRASMAVSLETRLPFLDHRVAETIARIPLHLKIGDGHGKRVLRRLLWSMAPRDLFDRPKTGFAIPIGSWLKGPLRQWAEELLDERRLRAEPWFDPVVVRDRWRGHLSGRRDSTAALWAILMFQAWLDKEKASTVSVSASIRAHDADRSSLGVRQSRSFQDHRG